MTSNALKERKRGPTKQIHANKIERVGQTVASVEWNQSGGEQIERTI